MPVWKDKNFTAMFTLKFVLLRFFSFVLVAILAKYGFLLNQEVKLVLPYAFCAKSRVLVLAIESAGLFSCLTYLMVDNSCCSYA